MNLRQIARKWEDLAQEKQFTELDRAKATATSWLGYISTLVGAIGIVGLAVKPDVLEKLSSEKVTGVEYSIIAITIFYLLAIVSAIFAVRPTPVDTYNNGGSYENYTGKAVLRTWRYLSLSRIFTIVAVGILLITSVVVLLDDPPAKPLYFIANIEKDSARTAYCGVLKTEADGSTSLVATPENIPLKGVVTLTAVTKCN